MALVAPSSVDDGAFTESMVASLDRLSGIGAVSVTEGAFEPEVAGEAIRSSAEDGYDLVIAHGSQYGAAVRRIAAEFPGTAFVWGTAVDTFGHENVYSYEAAAEEGGFVLGVVGAEITDSGRIGVVAPVEVGDAKRYVDGFVAGVHSVDPSLEVLVRYTGSFADERLAAETATDLIEAGVDVMTGTAQMAQGAVEVAARHGVAWFGNQSLHGPNAAEVTVADQVYRWDVVLQGIVDDIRSGQPSGTVVEITLANGGLDVVVNASFGLERTIEATVDEVVAGIRKGAIDPGV